MSNGFAALATRHRRNDRDLEGRLRVVRVVDEVETIGDGVRFVSLAIARRQGRTKLGFIAVGGFMQVDMHEEATTQRSDKAHQRRRFRRRARFAERTIGIDGVCVPAMDAFVGPGADAGNHQQIHPAGVTRRVLLQEQQGTMHAAGFIAMHATGHQHHGQVIAPISIADREQRIGPIGRIVDLAVALHVEARAQRVNDRHHFVGMTAVLALARAPFGLLRIAPGLAWRTDGLDGGGIVHARSSSERSEDAGL
jgi:hypothetical protein